MKLNLKNTYFFLTLILIFGLVIRVYFAFKMPITNDEGAYLYDALNIRMGFIPYKDFLTKGVFLIYPLSYLTAISPHSIVMGRLISIIAGLLSSVTLFFLVKEFTNKKDLAFLTAALFIFSPPTVLFTIYIHTEPLQMVFVLLSLLLLQKAIKLQKLTFFIGAGMILGISFFVRVTSLGLLLFISSYLFIVFKKDLYKTMYYLTGFLLGFSLLLVPVLFVALPNLGINKTLDLYGFEMTKQVIGQKSISIGTKNISLLMQPIKDFMNESQILFKEGLIVLLLFTLSNLREIRIKKDFGQLYVLTTVWIVTLIVVYSVWIKFRSPYLTEFLSPLILGSAVSLYWILNQFKNYSTKVWFLVILGVFFLFDYKLLLSSPYMGSQPPSVVYSVADYLKNNTRPGEEILTASTIFPYVSGNRIPFHLSHPSWYGAKSISEESLRMYFPSFNTYENYIKSNHIRYVLLDGYTKDSFFSLHKEFENYVMDNYEVVRDFKSVEILKLKSVDKLN